MYHDIYSTLQQHIFDSPDPESPGSSAPSYIRYCDTATNFDGVTDDCQTSDLYGTLTVWCVCGEGDYCNGAGVERGYAVVVIGSVMLSVLGIFIK